MPSIRAFTVNNPIAAFLLILTLSMLSTCAQAVVKQTPAPELFTPAPATTNINRDELVTVLPRDAIQ